MNRPVSLVLAAVVVGWLGSARADTSLVIETFSSPLAEYPDPACPSSPAFGEMVGVGIAGIRSIQTVGTCSQPVPVMAHLPTPPDEGAARVWLGSYGLVGSVQSVTIRYRKFGLVSLGPLGEIVIEGGGGTWVTETACCLGVASVTVELASASGTSSLSKFVRGGSGQLRFALAEFAGTVDAAAISEVAVTFSIGPGQDYCDIGGPYGSCYSVALDWTVDRIVALSPSDLDGDSVADAIDNCPSTPNPSQSDCNSDAVGDACEIASGASDHNSNGVPDNCECIADLFPNGTVNGADLGILLSEWGPVSPPSVSDLNRDGLVDGSDLGYLLSQWGLCTN